MTDPASTPDIPRDFWSEYLERPFETCIQCESELLNENTTGYLIQKNIVAGETVFEMAICINCARGMQAEYSQQSIRSLTEFIHNAPARRRQQIERTTASEFHSGISETGTSDDDDLIQQLLVHQEQMLKCCGICNKSRQECHRYSIGTFCMTSSMLTALPGPNDLGSPFVICDDCEIALNDCISQQTRDVWDRFVEDNFDGPPGITVDPHELTMVF